MRPMPSPLGTNNARLYLRDRAEAAYDAALSDDPDRASTISAVLKALSEKDLLSDDEVAKILESLGIGGDSPDDESDGMASDSVIMARRRAQVAAGQRPASCLREPIPRSVSAADQKRFDEMFPHAKRIRQGY